MAVSYATTVDTNITTSAAQTVNRWDARLIRDIYKKGFWTKFMGKNGTNGFAGEEFAIHVDEDFIKSAGDKKKFDLAVALTGTGRTGAQQLLDNEESMSEAQFSVTIDEMKHAVRSASRMARQRPAFHKSGDKDIAEKFRMDGKNRLGDWWAELFIDKKVGQQLCGDTNQTFANTATAPSTGRVIYSGGRSSTGDIVPADKFHLGLIDEAVTMAKTRYASAVPRIRPAAINGLPGKHYIVVIHPYQTRDMRLNVSEGQWLDITKAAGLRGDVNKIFAGVQNNFVGYYNGCAIFEHDSIFTSSTWGPGSDVAGATALFLGAQALCWCWAAYPDWVEEWIDYRAKLGIATRAICGFQKTLFTISSVAYDFATIAMQTAAASTAV